ncbi:MAG: imidazole glycerol phosphate synthase subunit HisH [Rhodospirillaceae bacterium]|nr:imidazole glycerol phosphate synthase subunit HisH [Rhodospirillaceae bacterium]
MTVAIIDYGSGNLRSAAKAFERAARDAGYAGPVAVTADADVVAKADHIVLPGVGAFPDCRRGLDAVPGMVAALSEAVIAKGKPFLGICVGMQLMATRGREHQDTPGLSWIGGDVVMLRASENAAAQGPGGTGFRIPHMGWNELNISAPNHPLLKGIRTGDHAYFVHSYHMQCANPAHVLATVDYGGPVTALIGRDNMAGTQFHPEKSQATGLKLIANFLAWTP